MTTEANRADIAAIAVDAADAVSLRPDLTVPACRMYQRLIFIEYMCAVFVEVGL